jgi:hypothetical protein
MDEPSTIYDVRRIGGGYEDLIPEQFADREGERLLIQRRVEAAQTGKVEYPLVEFYGVVGQGKSWLLSYLAHQYCFSNDRGLSLEKPTFSAKIEFNILSTLSSAYKILHSLTSQIKEQLPDLAFPSSLSSLKEDTPPENVDVVAKELAEFVTGLTHRYVPVLVFDAAEKADEVLLDWLEEQVVYPVIRTNRAIFVFSGRLWHRWKIFEVRRRVEPIELPPLDRKREQVEGTAELLTKLGVERAETIGRALYDYAFGHPLSSKVIFKELQKRGEVPPGRIDEHTLEKNRDAIAEIVQGRIIEKCFFDELEEHAYLEPLLWGVCILRKFNPTSLRHFTVSFIDGEYEQKHGGYYLDAIRDMQDTTLVQWNSAAGGYTLDPVVRKIMARNLSMREPEEFQRRHQEAVRLYDNWIEQFPRNAVGFLIERTFHQNSALQDGKTQQEIGDKLVSEFDRILKDMEKYPDVQWDLPDMAAALNEEMAKDEELMEVISEDAFGKLRERAERFREKFRGPWS